MALPLTATPGGQTSSASASASRPALSLSSKPQVKAAQISTIDLMATLSSSSTSPPVGAVAPPVKTTIGSIPFSSSFSLSSPFPPLSLSSPSSPSPNPPQSTSIAPSTTAEATSTNDPLPSPAVSLPPTPTPITSDGFKFTIPIIIGMAVGGAVVLLLIGGACWFLGRSRRRREKRLMEDDALGDFRSRRFSRRPHRRGYSRSNDRPPVAVPPHHALHNTHLHPPRPGLSRAEARASVQLPFGTYPSQEVLAPPSRTRPAFNGFDDRATTRSSAWTDNSEMDVFAVDGSSYARTLSTMSRPNSEYDLEGDPGATYTGTYTGFNGTHAGSSSPFNSPFGTYSAQTAPAPAPRPTPRELQTPSPSSYPPQPGFHTSPTGTFGNSQTPASAHNGNPANVNAWREQASSPIPLSQHQSSSMGAPIGAVVSSHAPAPSQMPLPTAGPSRARIPAPRLLVDTKAPLSDLSQPPSGVPLSAMQSAVSWRAHTPSTLDRAPSAAGYARGGAMSPETTWNSYARAPSRSTSRGATLASANVSAAPSPAIYAGPSVSYGSAGGFGGLSRPLVSRQGSRGAADRPSALPYTQGRDSVVPQSTAASHASQEQAAQGASGLRRGPTIIRHADGGAFSDAVPDGDGADELHLPPAYDDIYCAPT